MTAQQTIPNPLTIPGFLSRHESWVIRRIGSQCSKDRNHFIKLYVQGNVKCISRWLISPWDKRLSTWLRPQPYYYCLINISCTPTGNEKSAVILRHHSGGSLLFYSNYPSASQQTETMTLAVAIVPKCFLEPGGIQTVMDQTSTDSTSGDPMPVMQMVWIGIISGETTIPWKTRSWKFALHLDRRMIHKKNNSDKIIMRRNKLVN